MQYQVGLQARSCMQPYKNYVNNKRDAKHCHSKHSRNKVSKIAKVEADTAIESCI